jgi:hypothetical protein
VDATKSNSARYRGRGFADLTINGRASIQAVDSQFLIEEGAPATFQGQIDSDIQNSIAALDEPTPIAITIEALHDT